MIKTESTLLTPKATSFKKKIVKMLISETHEKLLGWPVLAWRGGCLQSKPLCAFLSKAGVGAGWHTHSRGSRRCPPHSPYHWSLEDTHTCSCPACYGRDHGSCRAWRHIHQCLLYTADLETQRQWMVQSWEAHSHRNLCGAWAAAG